MLNALCFKDQMVFAASSVKLPPLHQVLVALRSVQMRL